MKEGEWERPAVEEEVALQKLDSRAVVVWRLNQAGAARWGEASVAPPDRGGIPLRSGAVCCREQSVTSVGVPEQPC